MKHETHKPAAAKKERKENRHRISNQQSSSVDFPFPNFPSSMNHHSFIHCLLLVRSVRVGRIVLCGSVRARDLLPLIGNVD